MTALDDARDALAASQDEYDDQAVLTLDYALRALIAEHERLIAPPTEYRCPACGHWCVPVDDGGWICSKRGGCGSEWTSGGFDVAADASDEREALMDAINEGDLCTICYNGSLAKAADAILAAGFRRQGPITDAEVDAAERLLKGCMLTFATSYRDAARMTLEAARGAS